MIHACDARVNGEVRRDDNMTDEESESYEKLRDHKSYSRKHTKDKSTNGNCEKLKSLRGDKQINEMLKHGISRGFQS